MSKLQVGDLISLLGGGNAKQSEVLEGKTFSSEYGTEIKGTMVNKGKYNRVLTKQGDIVNLSSGYYSGGEIKTNILNLKPGYIKRGISIGGVTGSLDTRPMEILSKASEIVKIEFLGSGNTREWEVGEDVNLILVFVLDSDDHYEAYTRGRTVLKAIRKGNAWEFDESQSGDAVRIIWIDPISSTRMYSFKIFSTTHSNADAFIYFCK